MKKIGLMGGTFNPIHIGHMILAQTALNELELDEVWFIPAKVPYYKEQEHILSGEFRLRLVELAVTGNDYFVSSDIELKRNDETTYTVDTLRQLEDEYELYLIVGQDSLDYIDKWKEPEEIFRMATIVAGVRKETYGEVVVNNCETADSKDNCYESADIIAKASELEKEYNARIHLLKMPNIEISSSHIRELFLANKSIRYLVSDFILKELNDNKKMILDKWKCRGN